MSEEQYDITLTLPTITEEQSAPGIGPTDNLFTHQNAGLPRTVVVLSNSLYPSLLSSNNAWGGNLLPRLLKTKVARLICFIPTLRHTVPLQKFWVAQKATQSRVLWNTNVHYRAHKTGLHLAWYLNQFHTIRYLYTLLMLHPPQRLRQPLRHSLRRFPHTILDALLIIPYACYMDHLPSHSIPKNHRSTIRACGNAPNSVLSLRLARFHTRRYNGQWFVHCVGGGVKIASSFYSKNLWRLLPIMLHDRLSVIYIAKRSNLPNYFCANLKLCSTPASFRHWHVQIYR
jgi:hypothetical protein